MTIDIRLWIEDGLVMLVGKKMTPSAVVTRNDPASSSSDGDTLPSSAIQLERVKEELELVSYVTSHDLKAPLRAILFACEEWDSTPGFSENKEAQAAMRKIRHQAAHMQTLMQGLLDYLNLETYSPSHTLLDSNEIVATAMTMVEEKVRTTGAKITYDALPQVHGHRGRLTRLFANLLDNALKFHGAPSPVVHISARHIAHGATVEFCVDDNGIGIDEEYHTIIFQLYQRLHSSGEYPGEGIGLALSRKIVESHGGKLWVESAIQKGSRFRFTLPARKTGT